MEDPNVFTAPLTVLVTYRRLMMQWQEQVCADNPVEHYKSISRDLRGSFRLDHRNTSLPGPKHRPPAVAPDSKIPL